MKLAVGGGHGGGTFSTIASISSTLPTAGAGTAILEAIVIMIVSGVGLQELYIIGNDNVVQLVTGGPENFISASPSITVCVPSQCCNVTTNSPVSPLKILDLNINSTEMGLSVYGTVWLATPPIISTPKNPIYPAVVTIRTDDNPSPGFAVS